MKTAAPLTGWRAIPRRSVTALKLVWRALRRLRWIPSAIYAAWQTRFELVWDESQQSWRRRFSPRALRVGAGNVFNGFLRRKPVVYEAGIPRAQGVRVRPRIVHVIPNVFVGGSTQLIFDLCNALGEEFDMRILTSALPRGGAHRGVPITVVPFPGTDEVMGQHLALQRADVVHLHYWGEADRPWYECALRCAIEAGARIVLNVNTPVAPLRHPAISETVFVSDYVRQTFGEGIENARVIHPGIELTRFSRPSSYDPHAYDSIGMVYRLERDKLSEDSIDILIEVCRQRPRTRAIVIGDGSLLKPFVRRVHAAGQQDNILFTGAVPYASLPDFYRMFRIFIAPVWQESFGQVTPFAMSMGHAVAGNRVGALPEILQDDSTLGTSTADTVARILALLDDRERIDALGRRNLAIAHASYDVRAMTAAYERVYKDVLGPDVDPMAGFPPAQHFAV